MTSKAASSRGQARLQERFWFRFRQNRTAMIGAGALLVIVAAALCAPVLAPGDPTYIDLAAQDRPPGL